MVLTKLTSNYSQITSSDPRLVLKSLSFTTADPSLKVVDCSPALSW